MPIEIRAATDDDLPAMFSADGRAFGFTYTDQEMEDRRGIIHPGRFRLAVDGGRIVGIAGVYEFDMTVPGGVALPTAGLTWVHVATTHRRQGVLRRMMDVVHDDARERGEPMAALGASESSIYERFGYGTATQIRRTRLDRHRAELRADVPAEGDVRFADLDEARDILPKLWDRFRVQRAGEISLDDGWWDFLVALWRKAEDGWSRATVLVHADGFLVYRIKEEWEAGFTKSELRVEDSVWCTREAHAALWRTVTSTDLVATITSAQLALDDPLPLWLRDPRSLRTTSLTDGTWVHPLDPKQVLTVRRYDVADRLVLQLVDGPRLELDASPEGTSVRTSCRCADLTLSWPALGALLMGGVSASWLGRSRRVEERTPGALRRADHVFGTASLPFCSMFF